jgi:hypothetical protein
MDSPNKVAIVAPAAATYGTSRMHQQLTENKSQALEGVFRDFASALEWLGREPFQVADVCEEIRQAQSDSAGQN